LCTNSTRWCREEANVRACASRLHTRVCHAVSHSPGAIMGGGGERERERERERECEEGRKGRNTCTAATQQFRVRCYVSESVMPMWAEANLWSPVSARTCVAFVYVHVGYTKLPSCVTYAGTYRWLRTPFLSTPLSSLSLMISPIIEIGSE